QQPIAAFLRAGIAVVTIGVTGTGAAVGHGLPDAQAGLTLIAARAGIVVGAGCAGERRVGAARLHVAGVGGADVVVVAIEGRAALANAALTRLGAIADVAVGAGGAVGDGSVRAAARGVAGVGGARIGVVAVQRRAGLADAGLAGFGAIAGIAVGAGRAGVRRVLATELRIAAVGGADVVVVAVGGRGAGHAAADRRSRADATLALIARRADVAVVAGRAVGGGGVRADAGRGIARVGGAGIEIVAIDRRPRRAH